MRSLAFRPDIYFYPRFGPLDQVVFALRKNLRLRTAVVTHIVSVMNNTAGKELGCALHRRGGRRIRKLRLRCGNGAPKIWGQGRNNLQRD